MLLEEIHGHMAGVRDLCSTAWPIRLIRTLSRRLLRWWRRLTRRAHRQSRRSRWPPKALDLGLVEKACHRLLMVLQRLDFTFRDIRDEQRRESEQAFGAPVSAFDELALLLGGPRAAEAVNAPADEFAVGARQACKILRLDPERGGRQRLQRLRERRENPLPFRERGGEYLYRHADLLKERADNDRRRKAAEKERKRREELAELALARKRAETLRPAYPPDAGRTLKS
ncbi:MAG: hypothetical protein IT458_19920 [Planctomycetes bacterium]|nr:hypothetical protein [Planctomycetota bacterium]